jgi:hypothetical protein
MAVVLLVSFGQVYFITQFFSAGGSKKINLNPYDMFAKNTI